MASVRTELSDQELNLLGAFYQIQTHDVPYDLMINSGDAATVAELLNKSHIVKRWQTNRVDFCDTGIINARNHCKSANEKTRMDLRIVIEKIITFITSELKNPTADETRNLTYLHYAEAIIEREPILIVNKELMASLMLHLGQNYVYLKHPSLAKKIWDRASKILINTPDSKLKQEIAAKLERHDAPSPPPSPAAPPRTIAKPLLYSALGGIVLFTAYQVAKNANDYKLNLAWKP